MYPRYTIKTPPWFRMTHYSLHWFCQIKMLAHEKHLQAHKLVLSVCSKFFQVLACYSFIREDFRKSVSIIVLKELLLKGLLLTQFSPIWQRALAARLMTLGNLQDVFAQPQAVPQAHNTVIYLKVDWKLWQFSWWLYATNIIPAIIWTLLWYDNVGSNTNRIVETMIKL